MRDGFVGVHAVGTAAVRDVLLVAGELGQPGRYVRNRYRSRPGDMSGRVLLLGSHIEHHDLAVGHASRQLVRCHRLEVVALAEEVAHDAVDLGEVLLGGLAQCQHQADDLGSGQPVVHEQAIAARQHQLCLPQLLQMAGRVGDREAGLGRERFDGALTLGEHFEDLQAMGAGQRLADAGELAHRAGL